MNQSTRESIDTWINRRLTQSRLLYGGRRKHGALILFRDWRAGNGRFDQPKFAVAAHMFVTMSSFIWRRFFGGHCAIEWCSCRLLRCAFALLRQIRVDY